MKRIFILTCTLPLFACSSTSIYDDVANELMVTSTQFLDYSLSWQRTNISQNSDSTDFSNALASCSRKLEIERLEFMQENNPTKAVATIQLHKCLNDKGWKADVQQAITLH